MCLCVFFVRFVLMRLRLACSSWRTLPQSRAADSLPGKSGCRFDPRQLHAIVQDVSAKQRKRPCADLCLTEQHAYRLFLI